MGKIEASALAWIAAGAAAAAMALTVGYLRLDQLGDPSYVQGNLPRVADDLGFDLTGARKAGYQDREIAVHLADTNRTTGVLTWRRWAVAVGGAFSAFSFTIVAIAFVRHVRSHRTDA